MIETVEDLRGMLDDEILAEVAAIRAERDALAATACRAIAGLADGRTCVHGPAFDSNETYGNDCSICASVRPLVLALGRWNDGPAPTAEDAEDGGRP